MPCFRGTGADPARDFQAPKAVQLPDARKNLHDFSPGSISENIDPPIDPLIP